jgi:pantoate--beta-alanine ligase
MQLVHTNLELREAVSKARSEGKKIGFVPTMGALHQGHLSLVELAKENSDFVVVSIFVNPKQFGAGEDFERYPRTLGVDARLLTDAGVHLLYAPSVSEIYPIDTSVKQLAAGPIGKNFEGASRPGHFDGMLTVVSRLFDLVRPDSVYFGQKDAQQVALVRQMLKEQISAGEREPVKLFVGETIRRADGLALSSRNKFLTESDMPAALSLSRALMTAAKGRNRSEVLDLAKEGISPEAKLEYLELVDPISFEPTELTDDPATLVVAARVGEVRLLDNVLIVRKS